MDPNEQLDFMVKAADRQIDLNHKVIDKHLDECDRIHARYASQELVKAATQIISDPTSEAP